MRGAAGGAGRAVTVWAVFCVPAQHAFLADILPRRPGGAEARPGAGVSIAEPAPRHLPCRATPRAQAPRPPAGRRTPGRVPAAKRTCPATISEAVLSARTRVLRSRVPSCGSGAFNFGGKGWLGVRTCPQDS